MSISQIANEANEAAERGSDLAYVVCGLLMVMYVSAIPFSTASDNYIIGVVSATPAMVADASDLRWHNLFVTDEWGRVQYHEVTVPEVKDEEGNVLQPAFTKTGTDFKS